MTTPKSIVVVGRRWFQKTNGTTYHSAEIIVDGELMARIPATYGYGDHYLWTAFEWLTEEKFIRTTSGPVHPVAFCESIGCKLVYTVADVSRRIDL